MSRAQIADVASSVSAQEGSVVSKVVFKDERLDVTAFGLDSGEGLTEHTAVRTATVHVLSGRLCFKVDGVELDAGPGFWLHMAPGTPHSLSATEPTVMFLTLA